MAALMIVERRPIAPLASLSHFLCRRRPLTPRVARAIRPVLRRLFRFREVREHPLQMHLVAGVNKRFGAKAALTLHVLVREDVTAALFGVFKLAFAGHPEALCRPSVALHLGHRRGPLRPFSPRLSRGELNRRQDIPRPVLRARVDSSASLIRQWFSSA